METELCVGCHISITGSLTNAIRVGASLGVKSMQIFLSSPHNGSKGKSLSKEEIAEFNRIKTLYGIHVFVHGKYMYNFCRNKKDSGKMDWQYDTILDDLGKADRLCADLVIHQGKNVKELKISDKDAIENYIENINSILSLHRERGCKNKILLENSCKQGTERGYSLDELATIFRGIKPENLDHIGFCLDTCHVFVSGELDLRDPDLVEAWMYRFDDLIGFKYLRLIHANDSKKEFGACNDNHANFGEGYITDPSLGGNKRGMAKLVDISRLFSIPLVLETPGGKVEEEMRFLSELSSSIPDRERESVMHDIPTPAPTPAPKGKKKFILKKRLEPPVRKD
jgi:apurinic endonuclease APN1